jgi:hypothetical protein
MPNRIIRDGILTSKPINALSEGAELFYRRLMSVVDDFGRFHAELTILRTQVYPLKPDVYPEAAVCAFLAECERAGLVRVYESSRSRFLEILNFRQRTRAQGSKFPSFDGVTQARDGRTADTGRTETPQTVDSASDTHGADNRTPLDGQVRTYTETETETETYTKTEACKGDSPERADWNPETAFDELWAAYPAKGRVRRPMSQQYFLDKIHSAEAFQAILGAVRGKWARSEKWAKGFIMALPAWIDQECWKEDPDPAGKQASTEGGPVYRRWEPPKASPEDLSDAEASS